MQHLGKELDKLREHTLHEKQMHTCLVLRAFSRACVFCQRYRDGNLQDRFLEFMSYSENYARDPVMLEQSISAADGC